MIGIGRTWTVRIAVVWRPPELLRRVDVATMGSESAPDSEYLRALLRWSKPSPNILIEQEGWGTVVETDQINDPAKVGLKGPLG
jgi:hypothetical protein